MLSYRHIYHAGNHADILKHLVASQVCQHLVKKEAPFFYLDTHAGIGLYELASDQAQLNHEYDTGISRLIGRNDLPEPLELFVDIVKDLNPKGQLKVYPGSPMVIDHYLRQKDKMHLCELHPNDYPKLAALFPKKRIANVVKDDGFLAVKSMLPPPQKRGFVLMDPPYEVKKDYQTVVKALEDGYKRFSQGTFAIWYPVLDRRQADHLLNAVAATKIRNTLLLELNIRGTETKRGMAGSGMIVVNPPWTLEKEAQEFLPYLRDVLAEDDDAHFQLRWITPE
ncbi:Ribosomal RNA large subunit methyltransferase J [Marinomonas gallaica]|uniref:Ribosomal RNA large subunit methyltransferase J n=1 Tax=Marinomonas gallaica TaxID=1806667 RepID=A0A1C3JPQ5_9GAMM|nr:23S rRNA (adenine(2030)-N(6))-methyltransferase RlmJ [Marinomonas gallaica]SBT17211.1 Ribosomal RNA large subunit methyltransferase J [Marinomonas gallaica]SBT19546.1 Ribosomal RNA large subunit methyltransferase J [Marinomonas gallaica]